MGHLWSKTDVRKLQESMDFEKSREDKNNLFETALGVHSDYLAVAVVFYFILH